MSYEELLQQAIERLDEHLKDRVKYEHIVIQTIEQYNSMLQTICEGRPAAEQILQPRVVVQPHVTFHDIIDWKNLMDCTFEVYHLGRGFEELGLTGHIWSFKDESDAAIFKLKWC